MNRNINSLYLDLIKKTLSFMLWEEPGIPVEKLEYELPGRCLWPRKNRNRWRATGAKPHGNDPPLAVSPPYL